MARRPGSGTKTAVARLSSAFLAAVVIGACGDSIAPTASPGSPSPTGAASIAAIETPLGIPTEAATIVPSQTPVSTHSGQTRPPDEPTATPEPSGTGLGGGFHSPAFRASGGSLRIPPKYTCDGIDVSPPLQWNVQFGNWAGGGTGATTPNADSVPEFAIVVTDPDAGGFVHWVGARIPSTDTGLDEGAGDPNAGNGLLQGKNGFGSIGYRGPCPPAGTTHRYHFALYAFATAPDLSDAPTADEVDHAGGTVATEFDALYGH